MSFGLIDVLSLYFIHAVQSSSSVFPDETFPAHMQRAPNLRITSFYWEDLNRTAALGSKDHYLIEGEIGVGGWSTVYQGVHLLTGDRVAIKYLINNPHDKKLKKEFRILEDLKDAPNFLRLRDIYKDQINGKESYVPIFDYFEKESYRSLFPNLTKFQIKHFMYALLQTLEYAHNKGIIHRDIKPANVLMNTKNLQVRVIDWAVSDYYVPRKRLRTKIGTIPYQPPEVLVDYPYYNPTFDIWSAGCLLAEMAFQKRNFFKPPGDKVFDEEFKKKDHETQLFIELLDSIARVLGTQELEEYMKTLGGSIDLGILNYVGSYDKVPFKKFVNQNNRHLVDEDLLDLLEKMLVYDHQKRITAHEALLHPYFKSIRS